MGLMRHCIREPAGHLTRSMVLAHSCIVLAVYGLACDSSCHDGISQHPAGAGSVVSGCHQGVGPRIGQDGPAKV